MKGWSFAGLVRALKSAAFRDVGIASGNVLESNGPLRLGSKSIPFKSGFNWQTYDFSVGEVLYIESSSATNWPAEANVPFHSYVQLIAVCVTDIGGWHLRLMVGSVSYDIVMTGGVNARTFSVAQEPKVRGMGDGSGGLTPNELKNAYDVGFYGQGSDAYATVAKGYPVQLSGILTVMPSAYLIIQKYDTYQGQSYMRNLKPDSTWDVWKEVAMLNGRKTMETGSLELYAGNPFVDFHYNYDPADFNVRMINDASGILSITGSSDVTVQNVRGVFRARQYANAWSSTYNSPLGTPFRALDIQTTGEAWVPIVGSRAKKNAGYDTCISFGHFVSGENRFNDPAIQAWNDNGSFGQWSFSNQTGDIAYNNQGVSRQVLFRDIADNTYLFRDTCSYAGFAAGDIRNPYMRHQTTNTVVYLPTRQEVVDAIARSVQQYVSQVRHAGVGGVIIKQNAQVLVPGGCVAIGWFAEQQSPENDTLYYTQEQYYVPAVGWVNLSRV